MRKTGRNFLNRHIETEKIKVNNLTYRIMHFVSCIQLNPTTTFINARIHAL